MKKSQERLKEKETECEKLKIELEDKVLKDNIDPKVIKKSCSTQLSEKKILDAHKYKI